MRETTIHQANENDTGVKVIAVGDPGAGGQNNTYKIDAGGIRYLIAFQNGPVPEVGVNGVTIESLLAVCIDRLDGFQSGKYPCEENRAALEHMQAAMRSLHSRTKRRVSAGVEGKMEELPFTAAIKIDGKEMTVSCGKYTYENLVELAGGQPGVNYSMIVKRPDAEAFIMSPRMTAAIVSGTRIEMALTGNG